jgi:mannose-6-phosphate isomerase-like protein (cupin superfamily)
MHRERTRPLDVIYIRRILRTLRAFAVKHNQEGKMQAFEVAQLAAEQAARNQRYYEFIRIPALSMGLYVLPAGGVDPQRPHTEDEVYYVVGGQALIHVAGEDRPVQAGSIIVVEANVEHRFHSITEDLAVLVFFAPAEYSRAPGGTV